MKRWQILLSSVILIILACFAALWLLANGREAAHSLVRQDAWFNPRSGDHKPLIMAHQGGEGEWPSNTLFAFRNAVRAGADALDTDMHVTKDGVLVLMHDASVDRTTNGKGLVRDLTLNQIKQLDAAYNFTINQEPAFAYRGAGIKVPTVEKLFRDFPGRRRGIKIKQPPPAETAQRFCALIRKYQMQTNVLVSSFGQENMDAFRAVCPEVATSATVSEVVEFLRLNFLGLTRL